MDKERSPALKSRLDSLLKRQAESLSTGLGAEGWKAFRSDVRTTEPQPTRKIEELRSRLGSAGSRSPNHSFATQNSHYNSPLRERLGMASQQPPSHVASISMLPDRRHQSPFARAREKFDSFYDNLKVASQQPDRSSILDRMQALSRAPLPPRSPSNFDARIKELTLRGGSPTRSEELSTVISLDTLLAAREALQKRGLKGAPQTYVSELKAFCQLILSQTQSS